MTNIDYSKTVIYKIVCKDSNVKDIYVGSTTRYKRRCIEHKKRCNNIIYKDHNCKIYQTIRANGGWDNFEMIEIIKQPCKGVAESRALERHYYELLNCTMNTLVPGRTSKESSKLYNENNKEKIKERKRLYRIKNKDKILKYRKEYNQNNKDKINESSK
jgi:hypothetical protein